MATTNIIPTNAASAGDSVDHYRVVMLNGAGDHVLLEEKDGFWGLPTAQIPKFRRIFAEINSYFRERWKLNSTLLALGQLQSNGPYAVVELAKGSVIPSEMLECDSLRADVLVSEADQHLIANSVKQLRNRDPQSGFFSRLGWINSLQRWLEEVAKVGRIVSFSQLGGSADTCLIRCSTSTNAFWYKAVGKSNPKEFFITRALSAWLPGYLPRILAFDSTLNGWLMEKGGDACLHERRDVEAWVSAAQRLSQMQIESLSYAADLLDIGCIDARASSLQELVTPFFNEMDGLMQQQTQNPPAPLTGRELSELANVIRTSLRELESLKVPDVIGNSDFNPGNILITGLHAIFTDWSAAHAGHPAFTLEYLLAHFRKRYPNDSAGAAQIRRTFWEQWAAVVPNGAIAESQELVPLLAVFASAAGSNGWRDPVLLGSPGCAGYLRSLARIMQREAQLLNNRRSLA